MNVISASRRTDILAFYPEWFMNRIRDGYVRWMNPFSRAIQPFHLFRYLGEEEFRFNNRQCNDAQTFLKAVGKAASKHLTYAELTGRVMPLDSSGNGGAGALGE